MRHDKASSVAISFVKCNVNVTFGEVKPERLSFVKVCANWRTLFQRASPRFFQRIALHCGAARRQNRSHIARGIVFLIFFLSNDKRWHMSKGARAMVAARICLLNKQTVREAAKVRSLNEQSQRRFGL